MALPGMSPSPSDSPGRIARGRYVQAFSSQIFEAPEPARSRGFVPAGKRRDQTTGEMFGQENDKDLHSTPKTFVPRDDDRTAREKKLAFLSSDVLPHNQYAPGITHPVRTDRLGADQPGTGAHRNLGEEPGFVEPLNDNAPAVDPKLRRQWEQCSELFGRGTPEADPSAFHDPGRRITPSDFKWFSVPEPVTSPTGQEGVTSMDRSYYEKCSGLFERPSPNAGAGPSQDDISDELDGEIRRKNNVYYSDLFGRNTPMGETLPAHFERHPKKKCQGEDQIVVNQDWTDSKTEFMRKGEKPGPDSAGGRRRGEFNRTRLFDAAAGRDETPVPQENFPEPMTTDNSSRLIDAIGKEPQKIHQAHLQSTLMSEHFYDTASTTRAWQVIELYLEGLPYDADDWYVRRLCQGFDLQIVKVAVEMDPVQNLCKGRAKVMLRYNPERDTVETLVQSLERSGGLRVRV